MLVCPACDNPNEDSAQRCVRCGAQLPPPPPGYEEPGARRMGRTMLGVMPTNAQSATARALEPLKTSSSQGGFSTLEPVPATLAGPRPHLATPNETTTSEGTGKPKTLTGIADPKAHTLMGFGATLPIEPPRERESPLTVKTTGFNEKGPSAETEATPVNVALTTEKAALKGTLMGVSPFSPATNNPPFNPADVSPKTNPVAHKTMLGVAPPIARAETTPPRSVSTETPVGAPGAPSSPPRQPPYHKGTLLGVAMPGIAPLNPGVNKGESHKSEPTDAGFPVDRQVTPVSLEEPLYAAIPTTTVETANEASAQRAVQRKRLAWVFGVASSLLIIIIAVATLVWWKTIHLTVSVVTSETNTEQLRINCSNCQTGTTISLQGQSATFRDGQATLTLRNRLTIGVNRLALEVKRPNRTRSEIVNASVPVEFRVTSDLSNLSKDPPQLLVVVEAIPQTLIQIDGRTLTVGTDGKLTIPVDVSEQLLGPSSGVVRFERKLDYTVTQKDGTVTAGSVVAKTGITALDVISPGLNHITPTATFTLSGRTSPRAKLTANGHLISIAADGTFRQDMALSAPGATRLRVRAQEEGAAPRLVDISLERVTNLRQRADELSRSLETTYDGITKLLSEKSDSPVALHGEVVAQESTGPTTRLVVSTNCQKPPCLASVRYGAALTLKRGARIIAIGNGRLTKRTANDARDLTIDASLVMEESPK